MSCGPKTSSPISIDFDSKSISQPPVSLFPNHKKEAFLSPCSFDHPLQRLKVFHHGKSHRQVDVSLDIWPKRLPMLDITNPCAVSIFSNLVSFGDECALHVSQTKVAYMKYFQLTVFFRIRSRVPHINEI